MPRHDTPETQAETDERIERHLRELMSHHGVEQLIDLPRDVLRQAVIDTGEAGSATFNRILIERATP